MPKKDKKKKMKQIKQKQKQQISIVINSNNKSKRITASKQPQQAQQPARNNPPVVNIMGETRPQVNTSGNYSGLGQQNRIFATDSALEQRLTRLLKFENDQSANPNPAALNTKILSPSRKRSPSPLRAPPANNNVMDLNFFNTRRKQYEDEQASKITSENYNDEEIKTPSIIEVAKGKWNNLFSPNNNTIPSAGATIMPTINLLDDMNNENLASNMAEPLYENEEQEPFIPAGRKEWMKLKRGFKTDWAYDNQGIGSDMVQLSDDEIDKLNVKQLNALYDQVMQARQIRATKQI